MPKFKVNPNSIYRRIAQYVDEANNMDNNPNTNTEYVVDHDCITLIYSHHDAVVRIVNLALDSAAIVVEIYNKVKVVPFKDAEPTHELRIETLNSSNTVKFDPKMEEHKINKYLADAAVDLVIKTYPPGGRLLNQYAVANCSSHDIFPLLVDFNKLHEPLLNHLKTLIILDDPSSCSTEPKFIVAEYYLTYIIPIGVFSEHDIKRALEVAMDLIESEPDNYIYPLNHVVSLPLNVARATRALPIFIPHLKELESSCDRRVFTHDEMEDYKIIVEPIFDGVRISNGNGGVSKKFYNSSSRKRNVLRYARLLEFVNKMINGELTKEGSNEFTS